MTIVEFIKIVLRHKVLLIIAPIIMASITIGLTTDPVLKYETEAYVYTGIASGSSLELEKRYNGSLTNIAFDNLIHIIKSRDTHEEVAVRLLAQHLLLKTPIEEIISADNYEKLKEIVPEELYDLVVKSSYNRRSEDKPSTILPDGVSKEDYEKTVENLMQYMRSSNDNFIFELLNFSHPTYSIKAISDAKVTRIASSDLIRLTYTANDPGICKQTLEILVEVISKKYKIYKEEASNTVVEYFQNELEKTKEKLRAAEDKLLAYKKENKIINYYEQSKAVAVVREEMEVAYKNKLAELAGTKAIEKRLKQELNLNSEIEKINQDILIDKENLRRLKYDILIEESKLDRSNQSSRHLDSLQKEAAILQSKIDRHLGSVFNKSNSTDGIPMTRMMPEWISSLTSTEDLTAEVDLMTRQSQEFLKEVEKYAPFGANIKKIEREIGVYEKEYSQNLQGLNLAKLKFQDNQISANLVMADPPYFPINPIPSKRKIIIVAVGFLTFIIALGVIFLMEFFDNTLKNDKIASEKLNINSMGMLPKISKASSKIDLVRIQNRLMDFIMHNFMHHFNNTESKNSVKTKFVILFSTGPIEGKTVVGGNIAKKLKSYGHKILYLNHSDIEKRKELVHKNVWLYKFLGYEDPRVDYSHPFLDDVKNYLSKDEYLKYEIDERFSNAKTFKDLTFDKSKVAINDLDYVILELPNILEQNYSAEILQNSDLAVLICRSNRVWSKADENILNNIKEIVSSEVQFIINGVEIEQVETLIGEIPKKRSALRKRMKNLFKLQFLSKKYI